MTLGEKIKELRKDKKITQRKLANKLGVSLSAVCNWENNKFDPSLFNCIVMADVFGVSLDELCGRKGKGVLMWIGNYILNYAKNMR